MRKPKKVEGALVFPPCYGSYALFFLTFSLGTHQHQLLW